jgi:uncharacterized protein YutE (UPF0331/DUF86 family)/predicted nucleotidyltransferase
LAIWLFGSYARGEETPLSDLDLAYLPEDNISSSDMDNLDIELYKGLSGVLKTDDITLINLNEAGTYLAFHVLREGKILFSRNNEGIVRLKERVVKFYPEVKRLRYENLLGFERRLREMAMEIDRDKILYQLCLLEESLEKLREKAGLSKEEYLKSSDSQAVVERKFQIATESCLNIGNHIISRLGLRMPEDYASVFVVLAEAKIIPKELAKSMADMARFRNLLVHLYWEINHEKVYKGMKDRIDTLERFKKTIYDFLKGSLILR